MSLSYHHPVDVLRCANRLSGQGKRFAVVVTSSVTGGTMRAQGTLMCVPETGDVAGYISNGCVDADIIYQARETIKDGNARRLTYGEGSPFKDIALPCGGRIDLWIVPNLSAGIITNAVATLGRRESMALDFGVGGFSFTYAPKLRLRIAGKGESVKALASQALGSGFEVIVQSPESDIVSDMKIQNFDHLVDPDMPPQTPDDPWTAIVMMFHDHDWEPRLLEQALDGPAFYIGAMGSVRTHAVRCKTLLARERSQADIDRIRGPIGLIPSMRDANLLALSALGEIVKTAQELGRL